MHPTRKTSAFVITRTPAQTTGRITTTSEPRSNQHSAPTTGKPGRREENSNSPPSAHPSECVRTLLGRRPRAPRTVSAHPPDGRKCPRTTHSVRVESVRAHRTSVRCVRATHGRKLRPRFCRIPSSRTLRTRSDAFLLALGHCPSVRGHFGRFSLLLDSVYKALGCIRSARKPRGRSFCP